MTKHANTQLNHNSVSQIGTRQLVPKLNQSMVLLNQKPLEKHVPLQRRSRKWCLHDWNKYSFRWINKNSWVARCPILIHFGFCRRFTNRMARQILMQAWILLQNFIICSISAAKSDFNIAILTSQLASRTMRSMIR